MDTASPKPDTLLIIEDSPFQAKLVRKQIETVTLFRVLVAHTMHEAEAVLREHAEDLFLALIDLNLEDAPDGEAVDLCLTWNVPSLVLTARFDDATRARCIERRVVDYFFKGSISDMEPMIASIERVYKNQFVTALAVDDSRAQRGLIKHLLEVQRISVLEADSGEAALEILDTHPEIRLIVTDFQMPGMGGLELVRQARAKRRVEELSIIGLSAAGSGPLTARFLKNGANDFLTKPFEVEEFYWRVNQTLENQDMMRTLRNLAVTPQTGG